MGILFCFVLFGFVHAVLYPLVRLGVTILFEVWCLGWFSFVKKLLDFMFFRFKVGLTEMQIFVLNNHVKQLIVR